MAGGFIGSNPLAAPSAASVSSVTWTSGTAATVVVLAPSSLGDGGAITRYAVTAVPTSGGATVSASSASTSVSISGLTATSTYYFVASANNVAGNGPSGEGTLRVPTVVGQQLYSGAGSYNWTCPTGVTSVSVVAIGSGAGTDASNGGGGGGLGWINNYPVTAGQNYAVVIGVRGSTGRTNGGDCHFVSTSVCVGYGGTKATTNAEGGGYVGDGGGKGGNAGTSAKPGGGGGPGYTHNGGGGGYSTGQNGIAGREGSGGGGGGGSQDGAGGGGVGALGKTATSGTGGASGSYGAGGTGGSGGNSGVAYGGSSSGGQFGGGAGAGSTPSGEGCVRIIWPGQTRRFPSTNTADV